MNNILEIIQKSIDEFFNKFRQEIIITVGFILFVDLMIAIPFTASFTHTHLVRNFMVFGSLPKPGTFSQFAINGIQWLAFVDIFILLPAVIWSLLMPHLVDYIKKIRSEEE